MSLEEKASKILRFKKGLIRTGLVLTMGLIFLLILSLTNIYAQTCETPAKFESRNTGSGYIIDNENVILCEGNTYNLNKDIVMKRISSLKCEDTNNNVTDTIINEGTYTIRRDDDDAISAIITVSDCYLRPTLGFPAVNLDSPYTETATITDLVTDGTINVQAAIIRVLRNEVRGGGISIDFGTDVAVQDNSIDDGDVVVWQIYKPAKGDIDFPSFWQKYSANLILTSNTNRKGSTNPYNPIRGFLIGDQPSTVENNIAEGYNYGFVFDRTKSSTIQRNLAENNEVGFLLGDDLPNLDGFEDNLVTLNVFRNNDMAMSVVHSTLDKFLTKNNLIVDNTYEGNTEDVVADTPAIASAEFLPSAPSVLTGHNDWDDGTGGNFWDAYSCTDSDLNGICDPGQELTIIDANNVDNFPLINNPNVLDSDNDGIVNAEDACPYEAALVSPIDKYDGCNNGIKIKATVRVKDKSGNSCPGSQTKCELPAEGAVVRAFPKKDYEFRELFPKQSRKHWPSIFAGGKVLDSECVIDNTGYCILGIDPIIERNDRYFTTITRYQDSNHELNPSNLAAYKRKNTVFKDGNGDGLSDREVKVKFRKNVRSNGKVKVK